MTLQKFIDAACDFLHLLDVGLLYLSHLFVHLVDPLAMRLFLLRELLFICMVLLRKLLFMGLVPLSELLAMRLFLVSELIVQTCQCISMCSVDVGKRLV